MSLLVEVIFGVALALAGIILTRQVLADKELKSWEVGLILATVVYIGFALVAKIGFGVLHELLGLALFGIFVFLARRFNPIWLGIGWLLHLGWDLQHGIAPWTASYVPNWYPGVCGSFDLIVGSYIIYRIIQNRKDIQTS